MDETPKTDKALYQWLHRTFGVGDWSETSGQEYWKYEINEVGRMKRWRLARRLSLLDLWKAAKYCQANELKITEPFELTKQVSVGRSWWAIQERAAETAAIEFRIHAAMSRERALAREGDWYGRLLRAQGPGKEEVLTEWEASLPVSPTSPPSSR